MLENILYTSAQSIPRGVDISHAMKCQNEDKIQSMQSNTQQNDSIDLWKKTQTHNSLTPTVPTFSQLTISNKNPNHGRPSPCSICKSAHQDR